jgi:hypothetical protein
MKKLILFMSLACCLTFAGCNKDADVDAFVTEFEATTADIAKKIDDNPTAAGVDEAQKAFTAKKPTLVAKFDAIKNAREFQVSKAKQKEMMDRVMKSASALTETAQKNAMKLASDPEAISKFQALMKEYGETFKM